MKETKQQNKPIAEIWKKDDLAICIDDQMTIQQNRLSIIYKNTNPPACRKGNKYVINEIKTLEDDTILLDVGIRSRGDATVLLDGTILDNIDYDVCWVSATRFKKIKNYNQKI